MIEWTTVQESGWLWRRVVHRAEAWGVTLRVWNPHEGMEMFVDRFSWSLTDGVHTERPPRSLPTLDEAKHEAEMAAWRRQRELRLSAMEPDR